MAIAASELPELSRNRRAAEEILRPRVRSALGRMAFLLIPSALAYLFFGDLITAALFQRGEFGPADTAAVHLVLAAYALGLPASASSRVLSSTFYALRDTRTPALIATFRVGVSVLVGASLMFPLDHYSVGPLRLGAAGLALGSATGAWVEYGLLRRRLRSSIGRHGPGPALVARILLAGGIGVAAGVLTRTFLGWSSAPGFLPSTLGAGSPWLDLLAAAGTAGAFGVVYLGTARILNAGSLRPGH